MNSYLFSVDYPVNSPATPIGRIQVNTDDRCTVQYILLGPYGFLFSVTSWGDLLWSNPSAVPAQEAYQIQVLVQQNCSSLLVNITTDAIITIRSYPLSTIISTTAASRLDNGTIYAIIASVSAFILIIIAILFIIIYYNIQRAKHRVPPFFQIRKHSPAQGLSFLKSKSPMNSSSPYTLGVRDDDSSNSTNSDQTTSSPMHNRLLSGRYKVTEPPINTTIEELLSSYDNRSTSSSSNSSGLTDQVLSATPGAFRTTVRETTDHPPLATINEDMQWMNSNSRAATSLRVQTMPDDSMDIISESHEVDKNSTTALTNACLTCFTANSNPHHHHHLCVPCPCSSFFLCTSTHLLFSSSSSLSSGSTTTVAACQQQTTTTTTTVEVGSNGLPSSNHIQLSPIASTRC